MKKAMVGMMLVSAFCTAAQATVIVTVTSVPTPGLPTMQTKTVTVTAANGDYIVGYDGAFIGPMNQVNPFGMPTVFQDTNTMFPFWPPPVPPTPVAQDSQFLFKTTTADPANGVRVGRSAESGTLLDGAFVLKGGRNNPCAGPTVAIAQLVVPAGTDTGTMIGLNTDVLMMTKHDVLYAPRTLIAPDPVTRLTTVVPATAWATYAADTGRVTVSVNAGQATLRLFDSIDYTAPTHVESLDIISSAGGLAKIGNLGLAATNPLDARPNRAGVSWPAEGADQLFFTAPAGIPRAAFDFVLLYHSTYKSEHVSVPVEYVPEPATMLLLVAALPMVPRRRRRPV
jgi:hypothetical protein